MEDYQPSALSPGNVSTTSSPVLNMAGSDYFSKELLDYHDDVPLEASPSSELSAAPYKTRPNSIIDNSGATIMPSTTDADRICTKTGRGFNRHGKQIKDGQEFIRKSSKRQRVPVLGDSGRDDHILRERQRRDDMSDKFIKLEKLLPWQTKETVEACKDKDAGEYLKEHLYPYRLQLPLPKTAIVDDAIKFVSEMQNTLKRLEKKMQDRDCTSASMDLIEVDHNSVQSLQSPSLNIHRSDNQPAQITSPDIHVHTDIHTGEIIIEITCSLRPRFMTNLMIAMEELQLDVFQCNYSKTMPHILCILVAKQRPFSLQQPLDEIVTVLQCTLS